MINFMLDPKGDMPWDEDALAQNVLHLNTPKVKIFLHQNFRNNLKQILQGSSTSIETTTAIISDVLCTMVWLL